jgi:hypothetical protein
MSTHGYENCVPGIFYGFTSTENNVLYPCDTFNRSWLAIQDGDLRLNISLGRPGGGLIDQIVAEHPFI